MSICDWIDDRVVKALEWAIRVIEACCSNWPSDLENEIDVVCIEASAQNHWEREYRFCTMCSNECTFRCGICRSSVYCSVACFNADMPIHDILCGEVQKFATPPNKSARRGIFFPVDEEAPQFVWATTQLQPPKDGSPEWERLILEPFIGVTGVLSEKIMIWGNYIRSRPGDDQVHVFMKNARHIDGSKVNSSIAAVTGGTAFRTWRGGMLAMKLPTLEVDPPRYSHMDMIDFRDVVDFFRSYGSEIVMSDREFNMHLKGPASQLDDLLKVEFKLAGTSNSKSKISTAVQEPSVFLEAVFTEVVQNLHLGCQEETRRGPVHASSSYEGSFDETLDNIDLSAASSSFGETLDSSDLRSKTPVRDKLQKNKNKKEKKKEKKKGENMSRPTPQPERELSGVRINCNGDVKSGRAKFEPIKVPSNDPVWSAPIPGITRLVNLPLRVRRIQSEAPPPPAKSKWQTKPAAFDEVNEAVTLLHINVNTDADDWGLPSPAEWRMPTGSVVVVCEDLTIEVLPLRVEALCVFCQYVLDPVFEDSMEMGTHVGCRAPSSDVLPKLTPGEFEIFYQRFRSWKGGDDPTYKKSSCVLANVN